MCLVITPTKEAVYLIENKALAPLGHFHPSLWRPGRHDVAVGTPVAQRPPRGSVRALISAHGSYRGYLASKRTMGDG